MDDEDIDIVDRADALLRGLPEQLGLGGNDVFGLDDNNECVLRIGADLAAAIYFDDEARGFVVAFALGQLPQGEARHDAMHDLLAANHGWRHTAGATLSVESETDRVTLESFVPMPSSLERLAGFVAGQAAAAHHWRQVLAELGEADADGGAAVTAPARHEAARPFA